MRFFNTAGPCDAEYHYMLPAAERLPEAPRLVAQGGYFVVHAPRQTGKTTALRALAQMLTEAGEYAALHFTCEVGEAVEDDYEEAQRAVLGAIRTYAQTYLPETLQPPEPWPDSERSRLLATGLAAWARACPRRLVLFFDEIDALRGQSLKMVLRQLRDMYNLRPKSSPWSMILCGLRDVRDYKDWDGDETPGRQGASEEPAQRTQVREQAPQRATPPAGMARAPSGGTSSPFNIKLASMRLGDFSAAEVAALYGQHTADTGQAFTDEAVTRAFELTQGQPWLVNALAREIIEKMRIAPPEAITADHVETAKERLILARATHLDYLAAHLTEERVKRIIEPLMAGTMEGGSDYEDNFSYVSDLGLIATTSPTRPANPIYQEMIARVLETAFEGAVLVQTKAFVLPDGHLDMDKLLRAFAEFWQEYGEFLESGTEYHEVAPHLVIMAFLQRVVNGGGFIDREYGLGRKRMDVLVRWPYMNASGEKVWQKEAWELKMWWDKQADPLNEGLSQLDEYLGRLGLDAGILVLFDRRTNALPLHERMALGEAKTPSGRAVTVLRA